jgi:hypothetical protein
MANALGTDASNKEQTDRYAYAWPAALAAALLVHGSLALFSGERVMPLLVPPPAQSELELDVFDLPDEQLPNQEPGGGTPTPGIDAVAQTVTPVVPPTAPKRVAPKTRVESRPSEPLVHPKLADETPLQDAVEVPDLLSDAFDQPSSFVLPKPKAVRTTRARTAPLVQREVEPSINSADRNVGSTHVGSGPGRRGGPGGAGQGNGRVVTEKFAFGGPKGAFKADVCALPRGTASIGLVADCPHLLTFFADRINVAQRHFHQGFPGIEDRVEWFGIKYTGLFKVEKSGIYEFRLSSDDGSRLIIDDQLVINNDGTHAPVSRSGRILLAAGSHQLKLLYFQGPGTLLALQLFVTPPGRREKTFRAEF